MNVNQGTYANWDWVATIVFDFLGLEHFLTNLLRADSHVLLAKGLHLGINIMVRLQAREWLLAGEPQNKRNRKTN